MLRDWRLRRRFSQLALALEAEVSARHISFLESGRSRPSRVMVERLAECLDMPLAERNTLITAAGFASSYGRAPLDDDALAPVRAALTRMMEGHAPYPAILFDRHWNALEANRAGHLLLAPAGGELPANLIDILLAEDSVRARILNWREVSALMAMRLAAESRHAGGDPVLDAYARQLAGYAGSELPDGGRDTPMLTMRYDLGDQVLSLFSTVAEISSPRDVTVSDLRLELFFPADEASRALLEAMG